MQIKPIEWKYTGLFVVVIVLIQIVMNLLLSFATWKILFSWGDVRYVTGVVILAVIVTASWNVYVKFIKGNKE